MNLAPPLKMSPELDHNELVSIELFLLQVMFDLSPNKLRTVSSGHFMFFPEQIL